MTDAVQRPAPGPARHVSRPARRIARLVLWAEFLTLYLAAPLFMALAAPPQWIWPLLAGATALGVALLFRTPGFSWRELARAPDQGDWAWAAAFALGTLALAAGLCAWINPDALFGLARERPQLMVMILLFYPFLSALPQELFFRALFFRRYGALLGAPTRPAAMLANAALFALAHLFYWNWVAVGFTFVGGLVFAWAYAHRRSFLLAWALHAAAGGMVFLSGLGVYFYHGAIGAPAVAAQSVHLR
ncbi:CPBP family glutamic-type intramembrane protease [Oceanicella actignis]|uniref:CAAX protease self-immunity n=1 Tax=Oceanicella actignis TaxID=1189325 RepID=A0A1M7RTX0_9RHOB|nr:CPBP family glutamic-type intramembrane protease [Oceanicella actignis]SET04776.1 CAAX protease self-immunity [Oceanicella actignis]SHN49482.1 CAAX protease self-immunity [Oceanicella actignis]